MNIETISAQQLHRAARIKEKIETLQGNLRIVLNVAPQPTRGIPNDVASDIATAVGRVRRQYKKRHMSPAAKARLSQVARARWKLARKAGRTTL